MLEERRKKWIESGVGSYSGGLGSMDELAFECHVKGGKRELAGSCGPNYH